MLVNATLLIQDIQLLCFAVIFGVLALQRWDDLTRRWLWFSFLANAAGAIFDLCTPWLPSWISHGINLEMIPLSYALVNVSLVYFERRSRKAVWVSGAILLATLPFFLAWRDVPGQVRSSALADGAIALESLVAIILLCRGKDESTRAPRWLMGGFLVVFAGIELARVWVAFLLHAEPDAFSHKLEMTSAIAYIVNTSVLPLAFVWMMNARLEANLLRQSILDPLTRVLNRRGLEQSLERELARYGRYGGELTVAMLDLDHFKKFNDAYGHAAGDTVLAGVAERVSGLLRKTDVIGRFGGEEFTLLLPNTSADEAAPLLERVREAIRQYSDQLPYEAVHATASIGSTVTRGRRDLTASSLLREADLALYQAKRGGRNQVRFFAPELTPVSQPGLFSVLDA